MPAYVAIRRLVESALELPSKQKPFPEGCYWAKKSHPDFDSFLYNLGVYGEPREGYRPNMSLREAAMGERHTRTVFFPVNVERAREVMKQLDGIALELGKLSDCRQTGKGVVRVDAEMFPEQPWYLQMRGVDAWLDDFEPMPGV